MKSKSTPGPRKSNVIVKDLNARKSPKGGTTVSLGGTFKSGPPKPAGISDQAAGGVLSSY